MNSKWFVASIILAIVAVLASVYAFVQTVKAQAAEMDALTQKENAETIRQEKDLAVIELAKLQDLYTECQAQVVSSRTSK